ncbi:kinase-like domain-containing protein [Rhizophagus diaphanus]|nr:kinase-like domain-containing protein [Rhizophagus diaphanus] [Rhizophagus sp. MUCL 43196]
MHNCYKSFSNYEIKIFVLKNVSKGLKEIHHKQIVHCNFHIENILFNYTNDWLLIDTCISDIGLYGEVNNTDEAKIYGVIPYVAPEVLKGKPYTQTADIYSFDIIMYFVITGKKSFENCAHDLELALNICNGNRPEIPEISELKELNWYINLIKKCWDSNPNNRPNTENISTILDSKNSSDELKKQKITFFLIRKIGN